MVPKTCAQSCILKHNAWSQVALFFSLWTLTMNVSVEESGHKVSTEVNGAFHSSPSENTQEVITFWPFLCFTTKLKRVRIVDVNFNLRLNLMELWHYPSVSVQDHIIVIISIVARYCISMCNMHAWYPPTPYLSEWWNIRSRPSSLLGNDDSQTDLILFQMGKKLLLWMSLLSVVFSAFNSFKLKFCKSLRW